MKNTKKVNAKKTVVVDLNLSDLAKKLQDANIPIREKAINSRTREFVLYRYPETCLETSEQKRFRNSARENLYKKGTLLNLFVSKNNIDAAKDAAQKLWEHYKENFSLNDFSEKSLPKFTGINADVKNMELKTAMQLLQDFHNAGLIQIEN